MRVLSDQKMMELIEIIDASEHGVPILDLLAQTELLDEDSEQVLNLLSDFNYQVENCECTGKCQIISPKEQRQVDYGFNPRESFFICKFEKLIGKTATASFVDGSEYNFLIHRILFNEGKISFVGECIDNGFLQLNKIEEISTLKECFEDYQSKYSSTQIEAFLTELRSLSENEVRLVLKVNCECDVDITPKYHFLKKPYVIANVEGDKIWAASVELNDNIYAWLVSIKPYIEILDPTLVKRGILQYCQDRLDEVIEEQKVS